MQSFGEKELREGRKHGPRHIVSDIRNDHLPSTPKRPDQLLSEHLGTGASEACRLTSQLGGDRCKADIHERDGFVVRSVKSFVGMKTQGDSAIEVFGSGVEGDSSHGCFVGEGSHEHDERWTGTGSRAEGR